MCSNNEGTHQPSAMVEVKYNWVIPKSMFLGNWHTKPGEYIESPTFCDDNYKVIKWRLLLYRRGLNEEFSDYMSLLAICEFTSEHNSFHLIPPKIECDLKHNEGSFHYRSGKQTRISHDKSTNCWGFQKFALLEAIDDYQWVCRCLCSQAPMEYIVECKISHSVIPGLSHIGCPLPFDIGPLLKARKFSDVKLKVNKETFRAHKLILAACSPVFAAMFEHETLENAESFIHIMDTDDNVFKEMLTYIYTGQIPNLEDTVFDLLPLADKYQLDHLKAACAAYLLQNLTTENVLNVLILVNRHCLTQLKAKAIAFSSTRIRRK